MMDRGFGLVKENHRHDGTSPLVPVVRNGSISTWCIVGVYLKMAEVKGPSLTPRQGGALGKIRTRAGKGPPKEGRPAPFASALLDLPSNKLRAFFFQFVFMYSTALGGATHHAGMWLNPKS